MSDQLTQELQIYKTPATIRDIRQVFIYVQAFANTTTTSPLRLFTNSGRQYVDTVAPFAPITPLNVPSYYAPLGTKRRFRIWEQVNSLIDLNVPQDKYMIEISLIEAQIESDPSGWTLGRNLVAQPSTDVAGSYNVARSFDVAYEYDDIPAQDGQSQNVAKVYFKEALKQTVPQPLFVRIPQVCNGEPYNWTVINNGQTNDDKSHNVLIRHGQMNYQELELEFGHLTFKGRDDDYATFGVGAIVDPNILNFNTDTSNIKRSINNYQDYEYLDYNWEWYNQDRVISDATENPNDASKYAVPLKRSEGLLVNPQSYYEGVGANVPVVVRDRPFKYNQQVSNVLFRFAIKVIHLF